MLVNRSDFYVAFFFCWLSCLPACAPDSGKDTPNPDPKNPCPLQDGMVRMDIRVNADSDIFDGNLYPLDFSSKTILVNGVEYAPSKNESTGQWFVDVDKSPFDTYVAYLLQGEASSCWFGETPASDILIPNVQSLHRISDLSAIPLFARHDETLGNSLDFRTPYAVLDFAIPFHPVSVRLSSTSQACGFLSWRRSDNSFAYDGTSPTDVVLNCTGIQESSSGHYPIMVFGRTLENVKVRVCDASHNMYEVELGDIELEPGSIRRFSLDGRSAVGLLWFEGFDLCAWGGDVVGGGSGYYPSAIAPGLSGDDTLDGYEYAREMMESSSPGSGFIQPSFQETDGTVIEYHGMSDSYIRSRGFEEYMYMLRCREYPGYISVGTGSNGRGIFALYPLKGIDTIKDIEVSFRLCLDPAMDDSFQFVSDCSSAVIRDWYVDGVRGSASMADMKRITSTLTLDKESLGGCGQWKTVRVFLDNCTDATVLKWQAASSGAGNHGFYLDEISIKEVPGSWNGKDCLRILYWNIQNGMWADQFAYDNFVNFVKSYSPDICVWCEARTNYESNSDVWYGVESPTYLPEHWDELAARYGHAYVGVSRRDLEAFPQVVTSRYPIEKILQMGNIPGQDPILHGAGLFQVTTPAGSCYFVTLHLNPYSDQGAERVREITKIMQSTVLDDSLRQPERGWFVLGDFNSHSRKDSDYIFDEDDPIKFAVHDYISDNTALVDLMATRYPGKYISTTFGYSRFDYVYMDAGAYSRVRSAGVLTTGWTTPVFTGISNFYIPSDHRPILVDIDY